MHRIRMGAINGRTATHRHRTGGEGSIIQTSIQCRQCQYAIGISDSHILDALTEADSLRSRGSRYFWQRNHIKFDFFVGINCITALNGDSISEIYRCRFGETGICIGVGIAGHTWNSGPSNTIGRSVPHITKSGTRFGCSTCGCHRMAHRRTVAICCIAGTRHGTHLNITLVQNIYDIGISITTFSVPYTAYIFVVNGDIWQPVRSISTRY